MEWKKYFRHLDLRNRACSERHFSRQLDKSGKENSVYQGRSAVVVSDRTPFIFEFYIEKQRIPSEVYQWESGRQQLQGQAVLQMGQQPIIAELQYCVC
ncbi:uncharacterized protein LOC114962881 isoform X3 [Acropora millepora]|uniref:uncharacterized protein LOC114962881 isoform X3 n=1 Tax=Acropora millepora TaxID=45264 RepID=UPI001CF1BC80|nr:uncharacterized protein LOC114962881 isoform X3 [Acropora millepora]